MRTVRICVYGIVQGVGFRPFVSRIADRSGVKGSVANRGSYVEIFAEGSDEQLAEFRVLLEKEAPERSSILKVTEKVLDDESRGGYKDFQIIESERECGDIFVSPDIATCPKCKAELYDPKNRRYMHPFINCTACGPRLTILDAMPYDRERTSMKDFPMCPECEYEYTHSETRRYDAQPVCCNDCGPEVYIIGGKERGSTAITLARQAIIDGKIIAIKGIGGFHLCCDATNESAVSRLRELKRRPAKPFAVMARDLETAERECEIPSDEIRSILDGHQKPIVLLKRKKNSKLAPSVAPDNPKIGVMLPYAPVQMLLFDYNDDLEMTTDCFVMTSGNVSGAPICRTDEDAIKELSGFCDVMLSHNRTIRLRADDSVMDVYRGEPYMIRRSRGYAPLPVMTDQDVKGGVLAIGGELKNTFCIGKDQLLYESPYVGDMEDLRTVQALEESIKRMEELLETDPEIVACDMHPKYNTTFVAERQGLPVMKIQHHYAHILSCMAENDCCEKVIGLSFDGTGYGTDGTIWGGELLECDLDGFERIGSIEPFNQVGGDASSKEGYRIAAAMINGLYNDSSDTGENDSHRSEVVGEKKRGAELGDGGNSAKQVVAELNLCDENTRALIEKMASKGINTVKSTSAGRLFDAVSAILDIRKKSTFEGEASTTLQFRAEEYLENCENGASDNNANCKADACDSKANCNTGASDNNANCEAEQSKLEAVLSATNENDFLHIRTDELVKRIVEEWRRTASSEDEIFRRKEQCRLAFYFHKTLGEQLMEAATIACEAKGIGKVALSGGVFQNTLLLEIVESGLKKNGITVLRHHLIPPNDGGLALGQAAAAMRRINQEGR